jgi:hypothetical protein
MIASLLVLLAVLSVSIQAFRPLGASRSTGEAKCYLLIARFNEAKYARFKHDFALFVRLSRIFACY